MSISNNVLTEPKIIKSIYDRKYLLKRFQTVRNFSGFLCEPLVTEDYCIQSMADVSPVKWHLAHTSWFFETFILREADKNYKSPFPEYNFLFNSYYVQVGERWTRSIRGLLSRPTVKDVYDYRDFIDRILSDFISGCSDEELLKLAPVIEIGIHHEQQHQELILTDIKHVFSINPLHPVYRNRTPAASGKVPPRKWKEFEEGLYEVGYSGNEFSYDNESPRHKVLLNPFSISSRLITNEEYLEFIEDNGYKRAELWLSDGFAAVENGPLQRDPANSGEKWNAPMYWEKHNGEWWNFTLSGFHKVNLNEPVCHISYYEADAFARWKGFRLPSEAEWEIASDSLPVEGNFAENGNFHPVSLSEDKEEVNQLYGDVWEWTLSPYSPYPGYKTLPGALGEYNGKFMINQMVLRGGSCATSVSHIRNTYRNFFPPHSRWQFMGLRLAQDL